MSFNEDIEICVFPTSDTEISYDEELYLKTLKTFPISQDLIPIYLCTPQKYHPTMVNFLCYLYQLQVKISPDLNIILIPKEKVLEQHNSLKSIQLNAFKIEPGNSTLVGGTFDHIHPGHKLLLTVSALFTKKEITVGMNRNFHSKLHMNRIKPYYKRASETLSFLAQINENIIIHMHPIDDPAGPAATLPDADLLFLTEETKSGGEYINKIRLQNHLQPVSFVVIPLIFNDDGTKISSSLIREKLDHTN